MPTLVRLVTVLSLIAATIFAAMVSLAYLVEPRQHPIVIDVPLEKLKRPPADAAAAGGQPLEPGRP